MDFTNRLDFLRKKLQKVKAFSTVRLAVEGNGL
jgi:hypothetical protein